MAKIEPPSKWAGGGDDLLSFLTGRNNQQAEVIFRVASGHGKSWNLGRPFSRPGNAWKIAKVMESHGKVMEIDDNVMKFLLLH